LKKEQENNDLNQEYKEIFSALMSNCTVLFTAILPLHIFPAGSSIQVRFLNQNYDKQIPKINIRILSVFST
jgi:hypothetical protein